MATPKGSEFQLVASGAVAAFASMPARSDNALVRFETDVTIIARGNEQLNIASGVTTPLASIPALTQFGLARAESASGHWLDLASPNASIGMLIAPADSPLYIGNPSTFRYCPFAAGQIQVAYYTNFAVRWLEDGGTPNASVGNLAYPADPAVRTANLGAAGNLGNFRAFFPAPGRIRAEYYEGYFVL